MEEQLISFETAKLAKEKGFDWKFAGAYVNPEKWVLSRGGHINNYNKFVGSITAPTQSLLQKWLREKYKIHCLADCNASGWAWFIEKTNGTSIASGDYEGPIPESGRWSNYEDALESGLKEALKII